MVSPQDMRDLQDLKAARRKRSEAVAEFEAYFAKARATLTSAARALTDAEIVRLVKESRSVGSNGLS